MNLHPTFNTDNYKDLGKGFFKCNRCSTLLKKAREDFPKHTCEGVEAYRSPFSRKLSTNKEASFFRRYEEYTDSDINPEICPPQLSDHHPSDSLDEYQQDIQYHTGYISNQRDLYEE